MDKIAGDLIRVARMLESAYMPWEDDDGEYVKDSDDYVVEAMPEIFQNSVEKIGDGLYEVKFTLVKKGKESERKQTVHAGDEVEAWGKVLDKYEDYADVTP